MSRGADCRSYSDRGGHRDIVSCETESVCRRAWRRYRHAIAAGSVESGDSQRHVCIRWRMVEVIQVELGDVRLSGRGCDVGEFAVLSALQQP